MAVLATTTLAEAVNATSDRIKLTSTADLLVGYRGFVNLELFTVTGIVDSEWVRVQRGVDGTAAGGHLSAETVYLGQAHQFFIQDPVGLPPTNPEVTPWINILTGAIWDVVAGEWATPSSSGGTVVISDDIEALETELDGLNSEITALEAEDDALDARIDALEASQLADTSIVDPNYLQVIAYNNDVPPLQTNTHLTFAHLTSGVTPAVDVQTAAEVRTTLDIGIRRTPFAIPSVVDGTYPIHAGQPFASTLSNLKIKRVGTGTCTVAVQIGGVDVTSLTGIAPGTSYSTTASTGANTQAADAEVTLVVSGASGTLALYGYVEHTL